MLKHCLLALGLGLFFTPINLFAQQALSPVSSLDGIINPLDYGTDQSAARWQQICGGGFVSSYYSFNPGFYAPPVAAYYAPVDVCYPSFYQPFCCPPVTFVQPCPTCCQNGLVTSYYFCPICCNPYSPQTQQSNSSPAGSVPKMPNADEPVPANPNDSGNPQGTSPPTKTYKYDGGSGANVPVPNPTSSPQSNAPLPRGPYQGYLVTFPARQKQEGVELPLTFRAYGE